MTNKEKEMVSIWSIAMEKESAGRFRSLFFMFLTLVIFLLLVLGWMAWKFYPILMRGGFKQFLDLAPFEARTKRPETEEPEA